MKCYVKSCRKEVVHTKGVRGATYEQCRRFASCSNTTHIRKAIKALQLLVKKETGQYPARVYKNTRKHAKRAKRNILESAVLHGVEGLHPSSVSSEELWESDKRKDLLDSDY